MWQGLALETKIGAQNVLIALRTPVLPGPFCGETEDGLACTHTPCPAHAHLPGGTHTHLRRHIHACTCPDPPPPLAQVWKLSSMLAPPVPSQSVGFCASLIPCLHVLPSTPES